MTHDEREQTAVEPTGANSPSSHAGLDARDWFIAILVAAIWVAATVFIFAFGSKATATELLGAYGALSATLAGVYHWLVIKDSKVKDEC